MSIQALNWAFQQPLPMSEKFALVVLANYADDRHSCFPSQERIASDMGASVTTARRCAKRLEEAGYLTRSKRMDGAGNRTSDRYHLAVGQVITTGQSDHRSDWSPVNQVGPTGQSDRSLPVNQGVSTGQSDRVTTINHQVEPPENHQGEARATRKRASRLPDGWEPAPEDVQKLQAEFPSFDLQAEHADFVDYWTARADKGAEKLDWAATWRRWMRKAGKEHSGRGRMTSIERNRGAAQALIGRTPYDQQPTALTWGGNPYQQIERNAS